MINREEIGRDIKALLEGYADSETDVEITVQNENEADVYLNGKKFNTYLIKSKRFLRNIHKPEQQQKAFQMSIIIVRDELREKYTQYQGAELQLPATENEINDAMQRARITNSNQAYTVSECILYDENIQPQFRDLPIDIYKLNYLAKVLSEFTSYDHALFRGCIAEMNDKLTLNNLINAAYNLQDCSIIDGLSTDEQLGKIYTDNGWLEWLTGVDENIWRYIDYTALGRDIREKENGIYTKDGYFVNAQNLQNNYGYIGDGAVIDISGEYVENGIPLFIQWDSRWGNYAYGRSGTIGSSGCGPTSLAMVIVALTGNQSVNPKVVADWSAANGYRVEGVGTSWGLFPAGASKWGFNCQELSVSSSQISQKLREGKVLIASMGPGHFTKYGHFIVLRGITANGKILVNDPNSSDKSKKEWDVSIIVNEAKAAWAFWK